MRTEALPGQAIHLNDRAAGDDHGDPVVRAVGERSGAAVGLLGDGLAGVSPEGFAGGQVDGMALPGRRSGLILAGGAKPVVTPEEWIEFP